MAHEVETMAYANAVPWHGLGAKVDSNLTPDEMLEAAGLDWEVKMMPSYALMPDGGMVEIPNKNALVRMSDRRVLTVASPDWQPLQNRDMLNFMRNYVAAGGASLETAGSLRGGKTVWGLAKLNHHFEVRPGDRSEGYLLFTSPHEVGKAITIKTTTIRVVCANTLALADSEATTNYSQNHLSSFNEKAAKERIGEAHEQLAQAERQAKILDGLKIGMDDAIKKVLAPVFNPEWLEDPIKSINLTNPEKTSPTIKKILASMQDAPGAITGTGWGVLNGVTHYADHVSGQSRSDRLASAWTGVNAKRKNPSRAKVA